MTDSRTSELQRAHYNSILAEYDAQYGDAESREYRRRFFLSPLLGALDLNGKDVADVAAGSGPTTLDLKELFPGVRPMGFDISEHAVETYVARTRCEGQVWDLTGPRTPDRRFDAAIVVGGLHHCVTDIDVALRNLAEIVRPGGWLLIVEPSRDTWFEPLRQLWYKRDRYFEASTEGALSHADLAARASEWFEPVFVRYMGGLAYFVVYNSLVFRIPRRVKPVVASPLMALESLTNRMPWMRLFPYFVARWRRRSPS